MAIDNGSPRRFGDDDATPHVAMKPRPWVVPLGVAGALLIGALVFWQLNANRARVEDARLTDPAPNAQQDAIGLENVPPPPDLGVLAQMTEQPLPGQTGLSAATAPPASSGMGQTTGQAETADQRNRSPALIVDLSEASQPRAGGVALPGGAGVSAGAIASALSPTGAAGGQNPDEQFARRLGVGDANSPSRAQRMPNQAYTVVQGAIIPAVLETAVNSDLPGYVRAIVSRDVKSFDGANVLVPRGSRLVGQYRSGVALGQSRAFVIWTRLIRPDGIGVTLADPGTDALGRGGLEGRVDRHFLQRFGGAILLSLITAGGQIAANDSTDTQVIIASTQGAVNDAASTALKTDLSIAPTVKVPQGSAIRVFVTRDLDFTVLQDGQ